MEGLGQFLLLILDHPCTAPFSYLMATVPERTLLRRGRDSSNFSLFLIYLFLFSSFVSTFVMARFIGHITFYVKKICRPREKVHSRPPKCLSRNPSNVKSPAAPPYRRRRPSMTKSIPINTSATALVFLPPAPSPSSQFIIDIHGVAVLLFPEIPILDSAFDLATLSVVSCLILLSIFSLFLIVHLHLKSRRSHHLQNFNALWSVKLLLVSFVTLWALNESLRLPFFHRRYIYPFLLSLPISEQANLCKIHVVLSLGFFESGFLITLLFLLNLSIKKRDTHDRRAVALIFSSCLPISPLQIFSVFFSPMEARLPKFFQTSSITKL